MLLEEIKKIKSRPKELREFGITFGVFFLILTGFVYWLKHRLNVYLPVVSILFFGLAFLCPGVLKPLQKVWMALALVIGWVMSHVILGILFFLTVTPIALLLRLGQKRFMETKIDPSLKSYWHHRDGKAFDPVSCETQY